MKKDKPVHTLITGASGGLGTALAIECASRGMNLVLVALPGPELNSLGGYIRRNFGVNVVLIGKDLCKDQSCIELFNEVKELDLSINMLINNAGVGSTTLFEEGSIAMFETQIKLNVLATTLITRLFLDILRRNRHSYILNVGSMASFFYLPRKQVYGATKSFIYSFSRTLRREVKKYNIHVSVLCPGGMNTNLALTLMNKTGTLISRLSIMEPGEVVPAAINGLLRRQEVIIPGRMNKLFMILDKILPGRLKQLLTGKTMNKINPDNSFTRYLPSLSPIETSKAAIA